MELLASHIWHLRALGTEDRINCDRKDICIKVCFTQPLSRGSRMLSCLSSIECYDWCLLCTLVKALNSLLKAVFDENKGGEVSFWYTPIPHFLTQSGILGEEVRLRNHSENYKRHYPGRRVTRPTILFWTLPDETILLPHIYLSYRHSQTYLSHNVITVFDIMEQGTKSTKGLCSFG